MTNWNLIFRRTHLYLGLLLLPWLLIYGLSTVVFNHRGWFQSSHGGDSVWIPLWEKEFTRPAPPLGENELRASARQILADHGMAGAFFVQRQGTRLNIHVQNFWQPVRLICDWEQKKVWAERKKFVWFEVFTRLHVRTGYGQAGILNNVWAFIVDVFCVTMLIWMSTGLYLWWKLAPTRRWGFLAIGAGGISIAVLLWTL